MRDENTFGMSGPAEFSVAKTDVQRGGKGSLPAQLSVVGQDRRWAVVVVRSEGPLVA